ncbi:proteasome assembly chaperone family protein [Thermodesulfobacteriota bacterium]
MNEAFEIEQIPELHDTLLIAGFDGWGNALDISRGMVDYMIRKLDAKPFASIKTERFYNFDKNRPVAEIENGLLKSVSPPDGRFFFCERAQAGRDIILLRAAEPSLQWPHFVRAMIELCRLTDVQSLVCLGSMYDEVLHTDMIISALASNPELLAQIDKRLQTTINYNGPSSIQTTLLFEAQKEGFQAMNLWCHCPYYLQGTTHFGLMAHLGGLLASMFGFSLDTKELESVWRELTKQIQSVIEKNPDLQAMISDLRKAKVKGSWDTAKRHDKVIHLEDFLRPR